MKHGWVSQPVNSLLGGNQAPISLTQFGMREARVAAAFPYFAFPILSVFCDNKGIRVSPRRRVVVGTLEKLPVLSMREWRHVAPGPAGPWETGWFCGKSYSLAFRLSLRHSKCNISWIHMGEKGKTAAKTVANSPEWKIDCGNICLKQFTGTNSY